MRLIAPTRATGFVLAAAVVVITSRAGASDAPDVAAFGHRAEYEAHRDDAPTTAPLPPVLHTHLPGHTASQPAREVFGYLPYWVRGYDHVRWESLTTLAWFAVDVNPDGTLGDPHGWGSTRTDDLVTAARAAGVRVVLTATLFGGDEIGDLLGHPERWPGLFDALADTVDRGGGTGVNIDFEFVPRDHRESFVDFMAQLSARFEAAIPGAHVTLATPAVDWSRAYDYDQLARVTDGMMIMAYGFHWKRSDPGPLSPLSSGDIWPMRNVTWTVEDYVQLAGDDARAKMILGLPFYGYDFPAVDATVPGRRREGTEASARTYVAVLEELPASTRIWDVHSQTPYYTRRDPDGVHQVWYDDGESLGLKLDLIEREHLLGLGIWALGYEGNNDDFWAQIRRRLHAVPNVAPTADAGVDRKVALGTRVTLDGSASRDADPTGPLAYQWTLVSAPAGAADPLLLDADRVRARFTAGALGDWRFALAVDDGLARSALDEVTITAIARGRRPPALTLVPSYVAVETVPLPDEGAGGDVAGPAAKSRGCASGPPPEVPAWVIALAIGIGLRRRGPAPRSLAPPSPPVI